MRTMWVLLVVCAVECVESNPQPSLMAEPDSDSREDDSGVAMDGIGGDIHAADTAEVHDNIDAADTCVPACENEDGPLECGDDGCGGICGDCGFPVTCVGGVCVNFCLESVGSEGEFAAPCDHSEDCLWGWCISYGNSRPDKEGGYCSCECNQGCPEGYECKETSLYMEPIWLCFPECQSNCADKECGPDGCGGSCGECAEGCTCTPEGVCAGC